jgi:DNA polymerase-1
MNDPLLILDVSNLAYHAHYAVGNLSHGGYATGATYGLLRELVTLQARFHTGRVAFCFDSPPTRRREIYPPYKDGPKQHLTTAKAERARAEVHRQIKELHESLLPTLGFANLFAACGHEADDLIASLCHILPALESAIIISTDKDLFQLIRGNVNVYNPRTKVRIDLQAFWRRYGVLPDAWPAVKALHGDEGDNVPGIDGVGEITALKYVRGVPLPSRSATKIALWKFSPQYELNLRLVTLPFSRLPAPVLREDCVRRLQWFRELGRLGMDGLRRTYPLCAR